MVLPFIILCSAIWPLKVLADSSDLPEFLNETAGDVSAEPSTVLPPSSSLRPSRPRTMFGKDLHCPSVENAVSTCPKDTNWVYYSCCGGADMYCCEHIQTWLLSALAVVAILLKLLLIGCCVRCCCSYKRKTQQSYSFDDK
ncbi:unnamed protein product [Caenorhabditis sp. 36 PRJEB53466]|nr:unnamed protein product [Caenorhabditis sp. 36 PRJEB53466]